MSSDLNTISKQTDSDVSSHDEGVIVYEVLEALGKRAFVPFLAIPAILGLTPLGLNLFYAVLTGMTLVWVGVQLLFGREFPKLPDRLAYARLSGRISQYLVGWSLEINEWLNEVPNRRLAWVTSSAFAVLPYLGLICVGLLLPILSLAGQPVFLVCIAVLIYCVSILTRDGRYVLASATVLSIASIGPVFQLTS